VAAAAAVGLPMAGGGAPDDDPPPSPPAAAAVTAPAPAPAPPPPPDGGSTTAPPAEPPIAPTPPEGPVVVPDPESPTVLVNRVWRLPPGWAPADLVEPDVRFTFDGPDEKRLLRQAAAIALVQLFDAAAADGAPLAAVSGYRSEARQQALFERYVATDGPDAASRYSAAPGHSEHQTGLAVDVTGADGRCPAEACFADTAEAAWLAAHAPDHGFVVRYPAGAEAITGYDHEPWHLRFVGIDVARTMRDHGVTLEEHLGAPAVP
jgi:D-alanyl-D-alanine carboxypeptidase